MHRRSRTWDLPIHLNDEKPSLRRTLSDSCRGSFGSFHDDAMYPEKSKRRRRGSKLFLFFSLSSIFIYCRPKLPTFQNYRQRRFLSSTDKTWIPESIDEEPPPSIQSHPLSVDGDVQLSKSRRRREERARLAAERRRRKLAQDNLELNPLLLPDHLQEDALRVDRPEPQRGIIRI